MSLLNKRLLNLYHFAIDISAVKYIKCNYVDVLIADLF